MLIRIALAALIAGATSTTVFAAEPTGHYTISGKNPGGDGEYSGTVDVTQTGDTYKVVWEVDGETYIGTGIGNEKFLAVSYKSGSNTGLALYGDKGNAWEGIWTYAGGKRVGTESWSRK